MRKRSSIKTVNLLFWPLVMVMMLIFVILPLESIISFAQENQEDSSEQDSTIENEQDEYKANIPTEAALENARKARTEYFLNKLRNEISSSESELEKITLNVVEQSDRLQAVQEKLTTLEEQLQNLQTQIKNTEEVITNVSQQIDRKNVEIKTLEQQLEIMKLEISNQKLLISEYLRVLYVEQNEMKNNNLNDDFSTFKLLLSEDSISELLTRLTYSEILTKTGEKMIEEFANKNLEYELLQKKHLLKKRSLELLSLQLDKEREALEIKKKAKGMIVKMTRGEEKIYQELLLASQQQQEEVNSDIETLRKNLSFIYDQMDKQGKDFDPDDYGEMLNTVLNRKIYEFLASSRGTNSDFQPRWPIDPGRGITALFKDAGYVKVFGFAHNAVDIRAYHGTDILAPADGIVYKAKDNGYGYSYIILAHRNGFMTVYGHVSGFEVEEGDFVREGKLIGYTGATPGTKGAGLYTTGPHLHFEIIKDGKHVDPLDYMNLAYVDGDNLPEKYQAKYYEDREKVRVEFKKVRVKKEEDSSEDLSIVELVEQGAQTE